MGSITVDGSLKLLWPNLIIWSRPSWNIDPPCHFCRYYFPTEVFSSGSLLMMRGKEMENDDMKEKETCMQKKRKISMLSQFHIKLSSPKKGWRQKMKHEMNFRFLQKKSYTAPLFGVSEWMTNEEEKDSWRENCWNIFVPPPLRAWKGKFSSLVIRIFPIFHIINFKFISLNFKWASSIYFSGKALNWSHFKMLENFQFFAWTSSFSNN